MSSHFRKNVKWLLFLFLTYTTLYDKILSRLEKYALKREYGFYEKKMGT